MPNRSLRSALAPLVGACLVFAAPLPAPADEAVDLEEMSLEQLLDVSIVSASNTSEKLSDAPATVIVLTREDLHLRGYAELSEILDDLPGMQMTRPRGTTYFKNYWRGYRNAIGEPFLVMVDGMNMNHLYYNTATILSAVPLSNVDRVEVVYGPASSVYGPNAFMGVINVITLRDSGKPGSAQAGMLAGGSSEARLIDVAEYWKSGDFRLSATGRVDNGLDGVKNETFEYTKDKYYTDRRLWGGFLDNPRLAGEYESHRRNRALDVRAGLGGAEIGVMYNLLDTNYGTDYTADKEQSRSRWIREELSVFLHFDRKLTENATSSTLLRWRRSDVPNESYESVSYSLKDSAGDPYQAVDFTYWQALNSSWSLNHDFDFRISDSISVNAGLKYEQKDLQKAYDLTAGPRVAVGDLDSGDYPFPQPPVESNVDNNRILTEDYGFYVLGKYRLTPNQIFNVGFRSDHNSRYGTANTIRAGWVGNFGDFGMKALYGEAFQEPSPRLLYGGWTGSGSDPNLDPEKSKTFELSSTYKAGPVHALVSGWYVKNQDRIISLAPSAGGAQNLGDTDIIGADVHLQALLHPPGMSQLRVWAYYSHIFREEEERFASNGTKLPSGRVGDLAHNSVWLGLTATVDSHLSATLRGRYVGHKDTVSSNPIRDVGGYTTLDAVVNYDDIAMTGIGLSLRVTNLTDKTYFHTGVRGATGGNTPGYFDEAGGWHGSNGFYNSLLPQPGREVLLGLNLDF